MQPPRSRPSTVQRCFNLPSKFNLSQISVSYTSAFARSSAGVGNTIADAIRGGGVCMSTVVYRKPPAALCLRYSKRWVRADGWVHSIKLTVWVQCCPTGITWCTQTFDGGRGHIECSACTYIARCLPPRASLYSNCALLCSGESSGSTRSRRIRTDSRPVAYPGERRSL